MSTHRLLRMRLSGLGLPAFSVFAGLLLALPFWLSPAALARSMAVTLPAQDVTRAGTSVVRLLVSYTSTDASSATASSSDTNPGFLCTGLGVFVSSRASTPKGPFQDQILTSGDLVNTDAKVTCSGSAVSNMQLSTIQVFPSTDYARGVTPAIPPFSLNMLQNGSGPFVDCLQVNTSSSTCAGNPALLSFNTNLPQPVIRVPAAPVSGTSNEALSGRVIELTKTDTSLEGLQSSSQSAVAAAALQSSLPSFLTPNALSLSTSPLESGAPIVDSTGTLSGLHLPDGSHSILALLSKFPHALAGNEDNQVFTNWESGMDALYTNNNQLAHTAFLNAFQANASFGAAKYFANLAQQQNALSSSSASSSAGTGNITLPYIGTVSLWLAAIFGIAVLVVLLIVFALILGNGTIRRRRKLQMELLEADRTASVEARRIAEQEAAQKREQVALPQPTVYPQATPRQTGVLGDATPRCPQCHEPVAADARFCPYCRAALVPVSTTAEPSFAPPAPPPPAARSVSDQPTLIPNASSGNLSISEQPTVDIATAVAAGLAPAGSYDSEKTVPYAFRHGSGQRFGFVVGTKSDPGIKRKYKPNEDSLFAAQGMMNTPSSSPQMFGLFVVADGMGGHANGEDASRLAIQTIVNYILPRFPQNDDWPAEKYSQLLVDGIQEANLAVHSNNLEQHADMGTTVTGVLLVGTTAYVSNVGDSRTYLYRLPDGLRKVTNDHSVVASLVEAGIIKPDDIYTHPKRNQIYRSLGEKPAVEVDAFTVELQIGDKLLLCSDGLWDMVRDPRIEEVIRKADDDLNSMVDNLITAAFEGGGEDNVSVIVVSMTEMAKINGIPRIQLLDKPDSVQMPYL